MDPGLAGRSDHLLFEFQPILVTRRNGEQLFDQQWGRMSREQVFGRNEDDGEAGLSQQTKLATIILSNLAVRN